MEENSLKIERLEFDSDLWEVFRGAYGNIKEDLIFLLEADRNIPEKEKAFYMRREPESDYRIAFDNICAQLLHQGSFYSALYLTMPYLVKQYEYWEEQDDFQWKVLYLTYIGLFLSTDIPYNHDIAYASMDEIPKDILESYQNSIKWLGEKAKEFLSQNLDKLKQFDHIDLTNIVAGFIAILGDREIAFVFMINASFPFCRNCGYLNESIELEEDIWDEKAAEFLHSQITPAILEIGKWDGKSFEDTYLWVSNLLYLLGDQKDAVKLSYYYGTYTCPECGYTAGPVIDLIRLGLEKG